MILWKQKLLAAFSQLLAVTVFGYFFGGDAVEDEMLSSYSWKHRYDKPYLVRWVDWCLGAGHCQASYEWEAENYNPDRFKD